MRRLLTISVLLITLVLLASPELAAQCQACKSTVETNLASGGNSGIGLNKGILYLLAMPYVMIVSIGIVWYLRTKRSN